MFVVLFRKENFLLHVAGLHDAWSLNDVVPMLPTYSTNVYWSLQHFQSQDYGQEKFMQLKFFDELELTLYSRKKQLLC